MQQNELADALGVAAETQISCDGRALVVRPLRLGTLAALFPILEKLATAGVHVPADGSCPDIAAFLRGGPESVQFLALGSDLSADEVGLLTFAAAETLLRAVWEANTDFFRRSATAMLALDTRIWQQVSKALGSLPSKPLSDTATA